VLAWVLDTHGGLKTVTVRFIFIIFYKYFSQCNTTFLHTSSFYLGLLQCNRNIIAWFASLAEKYNRYASAGNLLLPFHASLLAHALFIHVTF